MPKKKGPPELITYVDDTWLIQTCSTIEGPRFAVLNGEPPKLEKTVRIAGVDHIPYQDRERLGAKRFILFPPAPEPYGDQAALLDRLKRFIYSYLDCPDWWIDLMAHYAMLTWVYQRFNTVPYLRILGGKDLGKTRFLAVMQELCCRSIRMGGASSIASLFRTLDRFEGTLIIDEMDPEKSGHDTEVAKILNEGYTVRGMISRCMNEDLSPQTFRLFGPKVIAGQREFTDQAFESRCLRLISQQRKLRSDIPRMEPTSMIIEGRSLRGQLLAWQMDVFRSIVVDEKPLRDLGNRACELAVSLYSISTDLEFKRWLVDFVSERQREAEDETPKYRIAEILCEAAGDHMDYATIVELYNEGQDRNTLLDKQRLGYILREMGIQKTPKGYALLGPNPPYSKRRTGGAYSVVGLLQGRERIKRDFRVE